MSDFHKPHKWTDEELKKIKESIPSVWPRYRYMDKGKPIPPAVAVWDGEKYRFEDINKSFFEQREKTIAENRAYFGFKPPTRWQRFKTRVRKAFWFLFRDEE